MPARTVPSDIAAYLAEHCPAKTDEALQPRFGISYNTWRKIEQGVAIRQTVAERLVDRVRKEQGHAG